PVFTGPLVSAAAYTPESAALAIEQNHADAIAFGRLFIANPDLVERIKGNHSLNRQIGLNLPITRMIDFLLIRLLRLFIQTQFVDQLGRHIAGVFALGVT